MRIRSLRFFALLKERLGTTVAFCCRTGNENGELGNRSNRRDVDPPSAYSLP